MPATLDLNAIPKEAKGRPVAYKPHDGAQVEFHSRNEDFVLFGGSKFPGKTHSLIFEATRQIDNQNYKALLIRRTFPRLQEMIDRARKYYPQVGGVWEGEAHRWRFPSGATIAFGHCQHEDSKYDYQGHEYAFIGFDQLEEFTESQVRFIMAQNRTSDAAVRCYVRATANPGGIGHWWIKRKFIDHKKSGQCYEEDFGELNGKRLIRTSAYIPATIHDNPTGIAANPQYLAYLKSLPDEERKAYLEGDWNAFASDCIFDSKGMETQQRLVVQPSWVGFLRDAGEYPEFVYDEKGRLTVWDHPEPNKKYLILADVGKGTNEDDPALAEEKGDNPSAALIFDISRKTVVARWHGQIDPSDYGRHLFGLGMYYNQALIVVESWPGPGISTAAKLADMAYPNLYKRKVWDGKEYVEKDEIGWHQTEASRDDAIAALQFCIRYNKLVARDQMTLDEMYSFIRKPRRAGRKVKMEARSGCYDDLVIDMAMAAWIFENENLSGMFKENGIVSVDERPMVVTGGTHLPGKARQQAIGAARAGVLRGFV